MRDWSDLLFSAALAFGFIAVSAGIIFFIIAFTQQDRAYIDERFATSCKARWGQSIYPVKVEGGYCMVKGPDGWLEESLFVKMRQRS